MIKILIFGCGGTMGRVLMNSVIASSDIEVAAGVDPFADKADFPFPVYATLGECDTEVDVIVDFSRPESLGDLLEGAVAKQLPVIIATTGYSSEDKQHIKEASEFIPLFHTANMSLGINLMSDLIQKTATVLGDQFDIEIIEKHHNLKKDAPSGTAYVLADALNQAFMNSKQYVFGRHTTTDERRVQDIGIHAVRGGTIVGEHQVIFAGTDEIFELKHAAHSKQVFTTGALQAVRFIVDKSPGYYSMKEMIGEQSAVTHMYTSDQDALITISNIPYDPVQIAAIFKIIGTHGINLDMISQTAPVQDKVNISFTLPRKHAEQTISLIDTFRDKLPDIQAEAMTEVTKISVTGPGMDVQAGVAARVFEVMTKQGIGLKAVTTSETKISYVISQEDQNKAVEAIKAEFDI